MLQQVHLQVLGRCQTGKHMQEPSLVGVVGGISSLYVGPAAGGAICAGVSTLVGQTLENHTRGGKKWTGAEIAMNTIVDFSLAGGVAKILPIKIDGITAGRNSMVKTTIGYNDPSSTTATGQGKTWKSGATTYTYAYDARGNKRKSFCQHQNKSILS